MGWNDSEAGKFPNLVSGTLSLGHLKLDRASSTHFTIAEASWESGDKWNGAAEAESKPWNDSGVALDASASRANEGGDGRTCRV